MFFLSGGMLLISALVYVALAEGGVADWAKGETAKEKQETIN